MVVSRDAPKSSLLSGVLLGARNLSGSSSKETRIALATNLRSNASGLSSRSDVSPAGSMRRFLSRLGLHRFAIFVPWIGFIIIFGALRPDAFLSAGSLFAILNSQSPLVFLAIAIVPTLAVGDFDLSVAANAAFTSTIIATLTTLYGWSLWSGILLGVMSALIIGLTSAFLVVGLRLNSIIMTLGMATLIDGIASLISGSQTLSGLSAAFTDAFTFRVLGVQLSVFYIVVVAAVLAYVLQATPLGRQMTFTGQAPKAAKLVGINTDRLRYGAYIGGALLASLSGIAAVASQGGITPGLSGSQLLPAFAAAFFSTVIFTIGKFNVWGTVVAIYFLTTGIVGLQILGLSGWVTDVFYGGALVLAVAGFTVARRRITGEID